MKILVLHGHLSMGGEERILLNVLKNLVESIIMLIYL